MKGKINLEKELDRIRSRGFDPQQELVKEAKRIIRLGVIASRQVVPVYSQEMASAKTDLSSSHRAYSLDNIRTLCIRYRLRFLDLSAYREPLPPVALKAMDRLEKKLGYIPEYKIIAPAAFFRLNDRDKDPLLFAQIAEEKFYLVQKWGEDLSVMRWVTAFPLRSLETFLVVLTTLCLAATALIPKSWLIRNEVLYEDLFYYKGLFFCWLMIGSFFFLVFLGLTFRKNFNDSEWDSKFFN